MSQHFTLVQSLFMHIQVCVCGEKGWMCAYERAHQHTGAQKRNDIWCLGKKGAEGL